MLRTAPKGAFTPAVTSFRNTSKLDTFFSLMTIRCPGKKGSPLRYTSKLFTVGCESHDPFVPVLVMLSGFGPPDACTRLLRRRLLLEQPSHLCPVKLTVRGEAHTPRPGLGTRAHLQGGRGGSPAPRGGTTTSPGLAAQLSSASRERLLRGNQLLLLPRTWGG